VIAFSKRDGVPHSRKNEGEKVLATCLVSPSRMMILELLIDMNKETAPNHRTELLFKHTFS
jgi:hypothetical protein